MMITPVAHFNPEFYCHNKILTWNNHWEIFYSVFESFYLQEFLSKLVYWIFEFVCITFAYCKFLMKIYYLIIMIDYLTICTDTLDLSLHLICLFNKLQFTKLSLSTFEDSVGFKIFYTVIVMHDNSNII